MSIGFSYNRTFYSPLLKDWAELMVRLLPQRVSVLVSSSSSGCALASAMIVIAAQQGRRLENIYVRKNNESEHGGPSCELWWLDTCENRVAAFVDDFINTGDTFRRAVNEVGDSIDPRYVLTVAGPTSPQDSIKLEMLSEIAGKPIHWIIAYNEQHRKGESHDLL